MVVLSKCLKLNIPRSRSILIVKIVIDSFIIDGNTIYCYEIWDFYFLIISFSFKYRIKCVFVPIFVLIP